MASRPADLPGHSLLDIETCFSVLAVETLSHRPTPAESGALRSQMHQSKGSTGFSMRRWSQRHRHLSRGRWNVDVELAMDLTNTVYAPDSSTIALSRNRSFRRRSARTSKAAVKMHTLLDLHGNIAQIVGTGRMASWTPNMPSICSCRKLASHLQTWIQLIRRLLPSLMCCSKPWPSSSRVPLVERRCSPRLW